MDAGARLACAALAMLRAVAAYDNGVGARPPMGWNNWCTDDACGLVGRCHEREVRSVADALVESGMRSLGYEYVVLDDCWAAQERDSDGRLQPKTSEFPSGMSALANYVHDRGLKLGLYTCVGTFTCREHRPGSFGNYELDAATFAEWGVDYVKADNCHSGPGSTGRNVTDDVLYRELGAALNATGRPMLFALCNWGNANVTSGWGAEVGQTFRIQQDHLPFYSLRTHAAGQGYGQGVVQIIYYVASLGPSNPETGPRQYAWWDPDFLETLFPLTLDAKASRVEFTFWCLWSAPLLVATDVRNMRADKRDILMNRDLIAVDQDVGSRAGDLLGVLPTADDREPVQLWGRLMSNGDRVVVLWNPGVMRYDHGSSAHERFAQFKGGEAFAGNPTRACVSWRALGYAADDEIAVRDLWTHADVGKWRGDGSYCVSLEDRDVHVVRARSLLG